MAGTCRRKCDYRGDWKPAPASCQRTLMAGPALRRGLGPLSDRGVPCSRSEESLHPSRCWPDPRPAGRRRALSGARGSTVCPAVRECMACEQRQVTEVLESFCCVVISFRTTHCPAATLVTDPIVLLDS